MKEKTLDLIDELACIPWFSQIGEKVEGALATRCVSLSASLKSAKSRKWNNFLNEIDNRFFALLDEKLDRDSDSHLLICRKAYEIAQNIADDTFKNLGMSRIEELRGHQTGLIQSCIIEREYEEIIPSFYSIPVLLPIYVNGHFACGWSGDKLPVGWAGNGHKDLPPGEVVYF